MKRKSNLNLLKIILSALVLFLLGLCALTLGVLYVENTEIHFVRSNKLLTEILLSLIIALTVAIAFIFQQSNNKFVFKITVVFLVFFCIIALILYFIKISGLEDKIDSVEDLRKYVLSYGKFTIPAFIILQFLQVIILPIPSFITIGVGVALFGWFWGATLSVLGIVSASILAFIIGRFLGIKVVSWLIGKDNLEKGLNLIKNKDKVILTFMFLFPFFPDDLLCFVSGLSTMSTKYFLIMITCVRVLGVTLSSLALSGKILPFDTWWGIAFWLLFFAFTVIICIYLYKNGEKVEKRLIKVFKRKG